MAFRRGIFVRDSHRNPFYVRCHIRPAAPTKVLELHPRLNKRPDESMNPIFVADVLDLSVWAVVSCAWGLVLRRGS